MADALSQNSILGEAIELQIVEYTLCVIMKSALNDLNVQSSFRTRPLHGAAILKSS